MKKYICPCCGYKTLDTDGCYDICPICFWEDDPFQQIDPFIDGGANGVSLYNAQKNYISFGACDRLSVEHVRKPNFEDKRDPDWKPIENDELYELKLACRKFLEGNYTIAELEYALSLFDGSQDAKKIVKKAENDLEMIRFCSIDYEQKDEALEAVKNLMSNLNISIE